VVLAREHRRALGVFLVCWHGLAAERVLVLQLIVLGEGRARRARLARPISYGALAQIAAGDWQLRHRDGKTIAG
jgi:hypothetical protein